MDHYVSSQSIIKALKGASDPPETLGPTKIEIAIYAWRNPEIFFPSKNEVLADWILSSFLRSKGHASTSGPLRDARYWSLLCEVLAAKEPTRTLSKIWLAPLLNRLSISGLATSFLSTTASSRSPDDIDLNSNFSLCMLVLWPLAASRMSLDTHSECLGAALSYIASHDTIEKISDDIAIVCLAIIRSFRQAFSISSNKKRIFSAFLDKDFENWICALHRRDKTDDSRAGRDGRALESEILQTGTDILFSVDALKISASAFEAVMARFSAQRKENSSKLHTVPMLFRAFVREVRKHRSAIFSSGSKASQEQTVEIKVREAGLQAFEAAYQTLRNQENGAEVPECLVELLKVVEEADLLGSRPEGGLVTFSEIAMTSVKSITEKNDGGLVPSILQILSILSRIDFDIVEPSLKSILRILLTLDSSAYPDAQVLLREILNFHTKTRTMSLYLSTVMESVSTIALSEILSKKYESLQEAYRSCIRGSFFSAAHLGELSRSIKAFLTPGQTVNAVEGSFDILRDACSTFSGESNVDSMSIDDLTDLLDKRDSKKPKRRKIDDSSLTSTNLAALSYSLGGRLVAVILPSLPFSTLSESVYTSMCLKISEFLGASVEKAMRPITSSPSWTEQIMAAAALRIHHALILCPSLRSINVLGSQDVPFGQIDSMVKSLNVVPELLIEMLRLFFDKGLCYANAEERGACLGAIVSYLKLNLKDPRQVLWDGSSAPLCVSGSDGHYQGALAVWHLLLDRWLPTLDEYASLEDIKEIARLCFHRDEMHMASSSPFSFRQSLDRTVGSAESWELMRLREAMVFVLHELSGQTDWADIEQLLSQAMTSSKQASTVWNLQQMKSVSSVFEFLLWAPREYLPRASRSTLLRRALVADLIVFISWKRSASDATSSRQALTIIRSWLGYAIGPDLHDFLPNKDNYVAYIAYLASDVEEIDEAYSAASLELISTLQRRVIRQASKGEEDQLKKLCVMLSNADYHEQSRTSRQSLIKFIDKLVSEYPLPEKLNQDCLRVIKEMYTALFSKCSLAMNMLVSEGYEAKSDGLLLQTFSGCLVLRRWLGISSDTKDYGALLVSKLVSKDARPDKAFGAEVFVLLLREYPLKEKGEQENHISLIASSYVVMTGMREAADAATCTSALTYFSKSLSVDCFDFMLSLLREGMSTESYLGPELQKVVHLSTIFIGNAPEGALKPTQEHFEECLRTFLANDERYLNKDAALTSEVLNFIANVCSDKPASLRLPAVGSIWAILSKILLESKSHIEQTHFPILHVVTNIAGSLVRLRRDLVRSTLPHLGLVLRLLLRALPTPRPQLGARQRAIVCDSFPWWLAPAADPARPAEAHAVARLLTTLISKTVPRTFSKSSATAADGAAERHAEALAGAFSKHAAPVLAAYIGALGDPLLVVAPAMREALAPGLYALCEMMGEHGRDALMASGLDATGRAALKILWKEYEKQRYVGKG